MKTINNSENEEIILSDYLQETPKNYNEVVNFTIDAIEEYYETDNINNVKLSCNMIYDYFDSEIINSSDMFYLSDLLNKSILIAYPEEILNDLISKNENKFIKLIFINPNELIKFCIKKTNEENEIQYILIILKYLNDDNLNLIINAIFLNYKITERDNIVKYLKEIKNGNIRNKYLLIFDKNNLKNNIQYCINSILKNKGDIIEICTDCLRIDDIEHLKNIIKEISKIKNLFNINELEKIKLVNTSMIMIDEIPNEFINYEQLLRFYFQKKDYKKLISMKNVPRNFKFVAYLKLGLLCESENLLDEEMKERFTLSKYNTKNNIEKIEKKYIFELYLKTKKITAALNIFKEINDEMTFIKILKKLNRECEPKIFIEALKISILKFPKSFLLLKLILSLIHSNDLEIYERIKILIEILENIDFNCITEKRWMYCLIYNNILDSLEYKYEWSVKLLTFCEKLTDKNDEEILYLKLIINYEFKKKNEIIYNLDENYNIKTLIMLYSYEIDNNPEKALSIFELIPLNKISDEDLILLIDIDSTFIHKHFKIRISLIKNASKRSLLTAIIFESIFINISYYGPLILIYFLKELSENINLKSYISDNVKNIIKNHLELLDHLNDKFLYNQLKMYII